MTDRRQWCNALFATIDSMNSRGFVAYLTPDAQFRFGSAPPVVGSTAIIQALDAFFSSVTALSHRIFDVWAFPAHIICRGEVRYTRLDGDIVTAPFCNVLTMYDGRVSHYDIYVDPTPLSAPRSASRNRAEAHREYAVASQPAVRPQR